jgi:dephospho-CoA kinase
MLVIGFAGRIGAGKTSAARYLQTSRGFQYVRYSQVLADWLGDAQGKKTRLQSVGWEVMAGGKQAELNRRLIASIDPDHDCAVDGLRHGLDYESLVKAFAPAFFLLYIEASPEVRWQHVREHGRKRSLEEFVVDDSHPVEQQIETLRSRAFRVIANAGSLQDFYSVIDSTVTAIQSGDKA